MEVHHHGHVHHNKKWKEYLFQFFMLFLAVFCGSIAEYQLEHKIERDREEQYIKSFVANLKSDTADLRQYLKLSKSKQAAADSLLALCKRDINAGENRRAFYRLSLQTLSNIPTFTSNDATSAQLRNSGGYRLIRKSKVVDSLTGYEQLNKALTNQAVFYTQYFGAANALWQQAIDLTIYSDTAYFPKSGTTNKELPSILLDDQQSLLFKNKLFYYTGTLRNYNQMLRMIYDYAVRLLAFVKKEYDLSD